MSPLVVTQSTAFEVISDDQLAVPFGDADGLKQLIDHVDEVSGVVWLHGLDANAAADGSEVVEGLDSVDHFSTLVRTLDAADRSWRVYGVTRNATHAVDGDEVDGITQAPLAGLLRVALNEYPALRVTAIDIDDSMASVKALAAELLADSDEDNLAIRAGSRFAQRIVRTPVKERDSQLGEELPVAIPADQPFRA